MFYATRTQQIAVNVSEHQLLKFSSKASRLGVAGFSVLLLTTLMLILTIDRTLNTIWRVRRLRPLGQRVLIYWAAITLGPLLLGLSLAFTSYVASASRGLVGQLPGGLRLAFDSLEFLVLAAGMAGLAPLDDGERGVIVSTASIAALLPYHAICTLLKRWASMMPA